MLSSKTYDLCIVGAGVAGTMVATQAVKKGLSVIVIEAGRKFDFNKRKEQLLHAQTVGGSFWKWTIDNRDGYTDSSINSLGYSYSLNKARMKAVGGSTLHWIGMAQRLLESDFQTASMYNMGIDWPINYADLEPYYSLAEKALGVSGIPNPLDPPRSSPYPMPGFPPAHDDQAWLDIGKRMGISMDNVSNARNTQPYDGRSQCVAYSNCNVCISGARYSADFTIKALEQYDNFTLLTETVIRRIETDSNGNVKSVYGTNLNDEDIDIKAKKFVIAAHAVQSAHLMLLSNIGNQSDMLGRNLMEHWYIRAGGYHEDMVSPKKIGFATLESMQFYDGKERFERGAIKLAFENSNGRIFEREKKGLYGKAMADYDCQKFNHWVSIAAELEHQPNPDSRISLDKKIMDRFGDPVPHIHFELSEIDRRTLSSALEKIYMLLDIRGVKNAEEDPNITPAYHHMGTCRMSDDPSIGVVNKNCKVHGINNLYVAGSSVFPTSGARQPTLTIAALAIRLGQHITA